MSWAIPSLLKTDTLTHTTDCVNCVYDSVVRHLLAEIIAVSQLTPWPRDTSTVNKHKYKRSEVRGEALREDRGAGPTVKDFCCQAEETEKFKVEDEIPEVTSPIILFYSPKHFTGSSL